MKKRSLIILIVSVLVLTGCANTATNPNTNPDVSELNQEIAELKKENESLKGEKDKSTISNPNESTEKTNEKVIEDKKFDNIEVNVVDKVNYEQDLQAGRYSDFAEFKCQVQNQTDKEIKGIQGIMYIKDMFGKKILNMQFDLTGKKIPSSETVIIDGYGLEINQFTNEQQKLFATSFEDLIFEYEIEKVIFTDDSIIE